MTFEVLLHKMKNLRGHNIFVKCRKTYVLSNKYIIKTNYITVCIMNERTATKRLLR